MKKLLLPAALVLTLVSPTPAFANAPVLGSPRSESQAGAGLNEAAIGISWNRVSGVTGYSVIARTAGEVDKGGSLICQTPTCSFIVGDLSGGVAYDIIVTSLTAGQPSSSVNFLAKSIPAAPSPSAPVAGVGQVSLEWSAPLNSGGLDITGYKITSSDGSVSRTVSGTSRSVVITGLNAGTAYTFRIVAVNALGDSATATFNSTTVLSAPGSPTSPVFSISGSILTASWTPPLSTGGSPITEYRVILRRDGADVGTPSSTTTTSTTFSSLAAGLYSFQVVAVNAVGPSARSSESNSIQLAGATLLPNEPIFNPSNIAAVEVGSDAVFSVSSPGEAGGSVISISVAGNPAGSCTLRNGLVRAMAVGTCVVTAFSSATATHAADSKQATFTMFATSSTPPSSGGGGGGGGGGAPAASKPLQLTRSFFTGTVSSGQTVTGDVGTWEKSENLLFRYQWHRCNKELINPDAPTVQLNCSPIFGAEQISYLVTDSEKDKFLLLEVIARDKTGTLIAAANVFSDTVAFGKTATKPTTVTPTTPTAKPYGITRLSGNKARFQAFDPVGKGKISYRLNGREVAWINARNSQDKKIRAVNGTPAFSKTVTLRKGKNTLEIWVKGKRQSRVSITVK